MNVSLDPVRPRTSAIGMADDPYKKYWWVILAGIALTALWLCLPVLTETAIGSNSVAVAKSESQANAERGLETSDNPDGAPGRAYDLSMDGAGSKGSGAAPPESMLYQSPAETGAGAAASGAPLSASARGAAGAAGAGNLAQALKNAGRAKDAAGWGEKARRGFTTPSLSGTSLGGLGAVSGHSSASAGVFGTHGAAVGSEAAHGLNEGGVSAAANSRGVVALNQVAAAASRAAGQRNADGAAGNMSKLFDGSKGQGSTDGGGSGKGAFDSLLDSAPSNLKTPDAGPTANAAAPPSTSMNVPPNTGMQIMASIAGAVIGAAIGGAVGGMAGQMMASAASSAVTNMMQQQQQQQQQQQCQQMQAHYPTMKCS